MVNPFQILPAIVLAIGTLVVSGGAAVCAAADPEPPKRVGPLAALPSEPGPHIAKIKALGENAWLPLGPPAADPKWGRARGRSWSSNMPAAPDVGGGYVTAEGVHAYVKPDGHYMNDVWFYDIHAHRWICLYPGIEVKTITQRIKDKELTVDDRGLLVDRDGELLPPMAIHAYGYLGYDSDERKLAILGRQFENYFTVGKGGIFEEANRLFEAERQRRGKLPEPSPFLYDVATGRFEAFPVAYAPQGQPYGANILVYVGSRKQFFYGGTDGVWYLDRKAGTWVDAKPKGTAPEGIDHCASYDSKRDQIYYYCREGRTPNTNFFIYDVKTNTWSRPEPRGTGPLFCSSYESIFNYDPVSDALVVIRLYDDKERREVRRGVYVYDPQTNAWADRLPLPDDVVESIRNGNSGFFDPKLNAYFCHFAGDSDDNGTMWAYRYKPAP